MGLSESDDGERSRHVKAKRAMPCESPVTKKKNRSRPIDGATVAGWFSLVVSGVYCAALTAWPHCRKKRADGRA